MIVMETSPGKILNSKSSFKKLMSNGKTVETNDGKKTKPYRLTIQIDKVYLRPCPKSKKVQQINVNTINGQKAVKERPKLLQCLVCKKEFSIISELYAHIKEHFLCDICNTEFSSQASFKKHSKIHESDSSEHPYRCHICDKLFDTKDAIKNHSHIASGNYNNIDDDRIQYCKTCKISFTNEKVFRKHLASHVEKVPNLQVSDKNVATFIAPTSSFGQLRPVLFNCTHCNENVDTIADIDKHTQMHLQAMESKNKK